MRKDVFIDNDSGGFSVIAGDAVDAIIDDQRSDDMQFVTGFKALLLELYGDDSMPVRFVIDEPLHKDEEEQWLARASWRLDAFDGRLMAIGGLDPDMLAMWKEETGGIDDGRGIAIVEVPAGPLRVDVYAHVGSMNGRAILSEARQKPGAAFRRSHQDRPFPLWLARMLEFSSEDDPGNEELWTDVRASMAAGTLAIDTASPAVIGFLIHVRPGDEVPGTAPEGGWFARDANARVPAVFPIGLATDVVDLEIESQRDRLLGRDAEPGEAPRPVSETIEIIQSWTGEPLKKIKDNMPPIAINAGDAFWLYWMAAMTAESPPGFEYLVGPYGRWERPAATPDVGVIAQGVFTALRPSADMGGWGLWRGARAAAAVLPTLPEESKITLAMAPRERNDGEEVDHDIGRALYEGVIKRGKLELIDASPVIDQATLADALDFVREVVANERIRVRSKAERQAFDDIAAIYVPEEDRLIWDGDTVRLFAPDERELLLLASAVFRARFGKQWKCDHD
jgi:hypothetical protein